MSAYRRVCKCDQKVSHSENHPPGILTPVSPKTKSQLQDFVLSVPQKKKKTERESSCGVAKKRKSLTNLDLVEFI